MKLRTLTLTIATFLVRAGLAQGDLCTNAVLVMPGTYAADGPFTGGGATHPDATHADWYSFDPNDPGYITVTSCGDGVRDTRVWVHTGSCGAFLIPIDGDDDGCPTGYPPGNSLLANVAVTPGNLYFIEWDNRWSNQGFTWDLLFHTCPNALPTLTATDSTVSVDWSEGTNGTAFTVELGPAGFAPGSGTAISGTIGTTTLPVTFTGLTTGTDYDVYVTLDCGGGATSPFTGPWPVNTTGTPFVPNDACANATPLTCGDTLNASTEFAQPDAVADCGTSVSAPGVWYSISGVTGGITVSTCTGADFDTKLNVYSGSCGLLTCVGGNDDDCGYQSAVTFSATANDSYYILVQGYNGETGAFTITASCDECPGPLALQALATDDEADIYWTSVNAVTFTLEYGPAGFTPGTGTVITGTSGVDGPPVNISALTAGTDYDVYVSEACSNGTSGPALLSFTTLATPPAMNALCTDALPITCGDAVNGSTVNGIVSGGPTCAGADITANGVWYTFTGNGDDVTMSLCNAASYDSKISVFTGGCGALACAAGNDDGAGCGTTSSTSFPTVAGQDYLVLIHGYQSATGTFTLTMGCAPPCAPLAANDECTGALGITPQPINNCVPVTGDNSCSYASPVQNPPCDPYATIQDVWYTFNTGGDADHTITIEAGTAGSVNAALYLACGYFTYIDCFTDIAAPLAFTGLPLNTDLYLRVWNAGGLEAGTFTVCDEALLATGLAAHAPGGLTVMPVPTRDLLTIEGLDQAVRTVDVIDLQGRVVMRIGTNGAARHTCDVSGLGAGTYLLRANGERPRVVRFVVE